MSEQTVKCVVKANYFRPDVRIEQNGDSIFGMRRFLMMENAGHGVADFVVRKFKNLKSKTIVAVCGTGNNGGDGFVASRHLAGYGAKVDSHFTWESV